jgi:hypothetical protein
VVVVDRAYSGAAAATIINTAMTATVPGVGGTISVADDSGYPPSGKFEIVVDRGQTNEENIMISSRSGTTFTIGQRGYDGSVASSHTSGEATCESDLSGRTVQLFVDHVDDVEVNPHSSSLPVGTTAGHDVEARHQFGAAYGTPVTPTALTPDIAGAAGTGNNPAREDHVHNVPAGNVSSVGTANTEGTTAFFARADHVHDTAAGFIDSSDKFAAGVVDAAAIGANAVGQSELADNAVDTGAIVDNAVTDAKIEDDFARGIIRQQILTTDNGPHTTDAVTDMTLTNVSVVDGHTYEIHFHCFYGLSSAGNWRFDLWVNGVLHDCFDIARNSGEMADGRVYWVAPATAATDDFVVRVDEVSAGGDLTLSAAAGLRRTLTITDLGVL